ncbi:TonB-dependent siderophore receptor [Cupriavidus sp. UGS-1]|uniref:TonB-dependent siderophore receptor n=1 Tax=Cupriavidus sp. UGS-1 TaxID=2899826 RepID=UPI001E4A8AD2|nr:TonB-dependent receptor [Cupriavidus sp. UGS-1]MCD9121334.1 TonB-dependent receptor [Cupriavidus sp. UGS-1]
MPNPRRGRPALTPLACQLALIVAVGGVTPALAQNATPTASAPAAPAATPAAAPTATAQAELPTVHVTAGSEPAYRARDASTGALGDKPLQDTPFSVSVVPQELIENRQAITLGDVFRGDPSVAPIGDGYIGESAGLTIRGLHLDLLEGYKIDGLAIPNWGSDVPLEHFERVELLKGLGGFMYGFGAPGGIANFVTKRPTSKFAGNATLGYVSDGVLRESIDVGGRFGANDMFGARVGFVHEEGDTFVDGGHIKRDSASVALDARLTRNLRWSLDGLYQQRNVKGAYYGIIPGQDFGAPVTEFVNTPRTLDGSQRVASKGTYYETEIKSIGTELNWGFADDWNLRTSYRFTQQNRGNADSAILLLDNAGNYAENQYSSYSRYHYQHAQTMATGKVRTGSIEHDIAAGLSWQSLVQNWGSFAGGGIIGYGNLYDPGQFVPTGLPLSRVPSSDVLYRASKIEQKSVFFSDTIKFNEQWSVLAGLRYTRYDQTGYTPEGTISSTYKKSPLTPTVALMYKPVQPLTLYGSYVESLEAGGSAPLTARNAGEVFGPLKSRQYEIGAKAELEDWTIHAALFQIQRGLNYLRNDNVYTQDGETRYRGIELSARGKLARDWTLMGGVTLLDSENVEASPDVLGKRAYSAPTFKATAYIEYAVPPVPGLVLTAGGQYVSKMALEANNSNWVPAYHTFDAGIRYSTKLGKTPAVFRLVVDNLTNEKYWLPSYGFILTQGAPRTVRASATFSF